MRFEDFKYDGMLLSDYGYIVCSFDSADLNTVSNGGNLTFNTSSMDYGQKWLLASTYYDAVYEATFSICKDPCNSKSGDIDPMSIYEVRDLTRWLNRRDFCKFTPIAKGYENTFYEGSFNIGVIQLGGSILGLELTFTTNSPYARHDEILHEFTVQENGHINIMDLSDDIGYEYVNMEVTCKSAGNLTIHNDMEDRNTVVNNCTAGEIITFNHPIINTSVSSHKIQNDFNYNFPRLANVFNSKKNVLTFSLPCDVKLSYCPNRKVGVF